MTCMTCLSNKVLNFPEVCIASVAQWYIWSHMGLQTGVRDLKSSKAFCWKLNVLFEFGSRQRACSTWRVQSFLLSRCPKISYIHIHSDTFKYMHIYYLTYKYNMIHARYRHIDIDTVMYVYVSVCICIIYGCICMYWMYCMWYVSVCICMYRIYWYV